MTSSRTELVLLLIAIFCVPAFSADMVVINANVISMDAEQPEAEAFAIANGRFTFVGSSQAAEAYVTPDTEVVDLRGFTVLPGFNDAHLHPQPLHPPLSRLGKVPCDPEHIASMEELIAALKAKADVTPVGEWVIGTGYQDTKLGRHPTRLDLDLATTDHPIYIGHSSGHIGAVNSLALDLAGIDADTDDPKGGAFDRDEHNVPNGVLRESARGIVRSAGPERPVPTRQETVDGYRRQFQAYLEKGITSIQIAGVGLETMRSLQALPINARPLRIYVMLRNEHLDELTKLKNAGKLGDDYFRLGAIKRWFGNSLSGRTCWLYQPYVDQPDYYGIPPKDSQDTINQRVREIHDAGFQACVHANGDREIDMLLNAYEAALQANPRANHRHRIEHCSVVNQQILGRIKQLGLVLATHSYVHEHGDKMEAYGEARWDWMHPNRSAMDMEIPVAGNSDSPVSAAHPMLRIQSMVTRRSAEGKYYGTKQRVSVEQALHAWTLGSAYAEFQENQKGSISKGKWADFVVLGQDPRRVDDDELQSLLIERTYIGGHLRYRRKPAVHVYPPIARRPLPTYAKLGPGPARENSGIVRSPTQPNVFWLQNDSGDEPRIYPVKPDGTVYRSNRSSEKPGVLIGGAINVDWEDIATDDEGHIIIADFGNNRNARRDLVLYYVNEPSAVAKNTTVKKKVFIRYPDQPSFPAPRAHFNYDAEALFTLNNKVYVLTKHRSDTKTKLYRLDQTEPFVTNELTQVGEFEIDGRVTAADTSPDGKQVVVATYKALWLFDVPSNDDNIFNGRVRWYPFVSRQVEAVCFRDPDTLIVADEFTAMLSEVKLSMFGEISTATGNQ